MHLHVHSHFSLLTGLPKIKELVKTAKERGFSSLALTDYGSMYGMIKFFETCQKEEIKPIVGCEIFVAVDSRFDKRHKIDNQASHLVLLAETFEGYQNLMQLSSLGHLEGFYYRPRVDRELLQKYSKGLIALSGCISGEVPQLIAQGADDARVDEKIKWYVDCFGKENFFLELQDHPEKEGQMNVNNALIEAAKRNGLDVVVTRDVHYLNKDDNEAQDILGCIKDGRHVDQPGRYTMRHVDRSLNTYEDMLSRFGHVPEALSNTVKIANRCNVEIPLGKWHFPDYKIPEGTTHKSELTRLVYEGLAEKYDEEKQKEYTERVEYELKIINDRGYAPYFLVVSDFLKWAKDNKVVTTTRGSAAGSLVSYCIDITNIDPMHYKLPFERFLNPFRPSPPDVDADIADYRRGEVIKYVTDKYGADKVAQICTFGTMAARASLRDCGRALGISYGRVDQIAKLVPMGSQGFPMTLKTALEITPDLKKVYDEDKEVKRLIDLAQKIEGCARHVSVHAAGVVISPTPLTDYTPLQREPGGEKIVTQYEMKSVENAGVLKMDFLGLRNLSILEEAMRYIKKIHEVEIDLENIPLDDKKTFEMLSRGETQGVFQLSGAGMTRYLKDLQPEKITDIMAMVALYRPGPMEMIPEYIARKHDPSKVKYLDPRLKDILDTSYGIITYQDDVLLTAIHLAGYDWGEADKLRKAMGKKIPEEMAKQKIKFFDGAVAGGMKKEKVVELWKQIEPFAAYGFNKAHACSYGMVAYQTAYLKANYPEEYMAAVLSCESHDLDKVAVNVHECEKMGIEVLPPDVNESFKLFGVVTEVDTPRIRFGLGAVKNVGQHITEVIIGERKENGKYKDLEDFLTRVRDKDLNKKSLESLIKCGAMDCFGERNVLLANLERILIFSKEIGDIQFSQQSSLFGGDLGGMKITLDAAEPLIEAEMLAWEKDLLGLYVSSHPAKALEAVGVSELDLVSSVVDPERDDSDPWVCVAGVVQTFKKVITKKGAEMGFLGVEDTTGALEVVVFPKIFAAYKSLCEEGEMLAVLGKKSDRDDEAKILAERICRVNPENLVEEVDKLINPPQEDVEVSASFQESNGYDFAKPAMVIRVLPSGMGDLTEVKKLVTQRPGNYNVYVKIPGSRGSKIIESGVATCVDSTTTARIEELVGDGAVEILE